MLELASFVVKAKLVPSALTNVVVSLDTVAETIGFAEASNLRPIASLTVVAKLGSSPNAAASSFNVFNVPGAESTRFEIAVETYDSVATLLPPAQISLVTRRPSDLRVISSIVAIIHLWNSLPLSAVEYSSLEFVSPSPVLKNLI